MAAYSSDPTFTGSKNRTLGTKGDLRTWLTSMKHMTYTKYTGLATEVKNGIMKEYKARVQTSRSTVLVVAKKEATHDSV